jgi:predicted metal-dependent enzyme (double-stranded beta helix superfamily)
VKNLLLDVLTPPPDADDMPPPTAAGHLAFSTTEALDALVGDVRRIVRRGLSPARTAHGVGESLAPLLGRTDLLDDRQREGDPERYRQHILHAEADGGFSVVALVWLPGQRTSVHDHLSWCVTGVHEGQEREHRYRLTPGRPTARLTHTEDVLNPTGAVSAFAPPGDIHQVSNAGAAKAISIHVYGADIARLGTSIRRSYVLPQDER